MRRLHGLIAFFVILLIVSPALAQQRNGNLFLTVTDEQGTALTGVQATVAGADFARSGSTNEKGKVRFIELVPGMYELTLSHKGFNTSIYPGLQIDAGGSPELSIKLQASTLVEEVIVTAQTPLLDKRQMGTSTTFTKTEIEQVPQARDPWSVIATIPGVTTDRVNVAGSEAGQQANITGKGDDGDQTVWMMDGVEVTDMAAIGGSATYFDFNAFEQINFVTAGGDFASQTPGVQLEFVTKQGSNRHSGTMRLLYTEDGLEAENNKGLTQPAWDTSGAPVAGNQINEIFEKNFDIGGPVVKDHLWYWFGFTRNDIDTRLITGASDVTELTNTSLKLHGQFLGKGDYKAFYTSGEKVKLGRTAYSSTQRPPETTWDQQGPSPVYGASISYFFTPNIQATFQYSKVDGGFEFANRGDFSLQIFQDESGIFANTFSKYKTDRPVEQYLAKGNYFFDAGSWDHELKYGFRYKTATTDSFSKYSEADLIATKWYTNSVTGNPQVYLYRELNTSVEQDHTNVWIGDTMLTGSWAISAGLHYSKQSGTQLPTVAAANGTAPDLFEAANFAGFDPGFTWSDIAPRLGATYTFDWEKRLLLRASLGQYVDQLGNAVTSFNLPLGYTAVGYDWIDANDNDVFDWDPNTSTGEIPDSSGPGGVPDGIIDCFDANFNVNIDPCDTGSTATNFKIDRDLEAPRVYELNLGAEWEVARDFNLGLTYTYRQKDRLVWTPYYNDTVFQSTGQLATLAGDALYDCTNMTSDTGVDGTFTWSEPFCSLDPAAAGDLTSDLARWETNMPNYEQMFNGIEFSATKRLSNKWMMRGFIAYNKWTNNFSGERLTPGIYGRTSADGAQFAGDPTNFRSGTTNDGGLIGVQSTASGGKGDIFGGTSTWQLNVNGLYQLPWNWSVSGNFYARQGYGLAYYSQVSPGQGEGNKNVQVRDIDSDRYDDVYLFDLRFAKLFTFEGPANVEFAFEVFNAFNDDVTLQLDQRVNPNSSGDYSFQRINEIVSPRILRLVATVNF